VTRNFVWPELADFSEERVASDVRQYGCHIIQVLAESGEPPFSYSIGLFLNFAHPEIVVFGLPAAEGAQMINNVRDLVAEGRIFREGSTSDDVLDGYQVTFLAVPHEKYQDHLGFALWFYFSLQPELFPCLQLVWPDKKGLMPWQAGFDETLRPIQPLLGGVA
jgi:Domain of unknown function (DUF4262)